MNKGELVDQIAARADVSKVVASAVLSSVQECISQALCQGDSVVLAGFGSFSVKQRNARQGRNPQTGATIYIAARKVPAFKAGTELKRVVAGN